METWASVMAEEIIQDQVWENAGIPAISLNIPAWMTWENADADAPTVSFINGGGVECPSF